MLQPGPVGLKTVPKRKLPKNDLNIQWLPGQVSPTEHLNRSKFLCPKGLTACPVSSLEDIGSSLTPEGSHECIDINQNLNSCGGCSTIQNGGEDCSLIPHANAVSL